MTGAATTGPAHAARPRARPARILATVSGVTAAVIAVGLGTTALLRTTGPDTSAPTSAKLITVTPSSVPGFPLTAGELSALTRQNPDYGPLADPGRRGACLQNLGYPASTPLRGARQVDVGGRPAVVLVLPGSRSGDLVAIAVRPECAAAVIDTTITSP